MDTLVASSTAAVVTAVNTNVQAWLPYIIPFVIALGLAFFFFHKTRSWMFGSAR